MAVVVSIGTTASRCCLSGPEQAQVALLADMISVCQQVMLKGHVVGHMLPALTYASGEGLNQPLTLLSRLVLAGPAHAQQYLQAHGLEAPILNRFAVAHDCMIAS